MERADDRPSVALRRLVNGYQVSQAIHVAATLGIADLLKDGPRSSDELAASTSTHSRSLYRLLSALASAGVFHEDDDRRFSLTPLGACLRVDAPEPIGGWAAYVGQPYIWQAWAYLDHSVRTGENAFRHIHGSDVWEYRARRPEDSATFDAAMTAISRLVSAAVLSCFDFARFSCVVDVGGGQGAFLASVLAKHTGLRGVLFDQPHVVAGAEQVLAAAGVVDRCRVVGGSFFDAVPEGGDAYLLKAVIHDWEDEPATVILRGCRRAMSGGGSLLLVERELGPPNEGLDARFSDLNMLVAAGGQERTPEQCAALLAAAGFRLVRSTPTPIGISVIEAAVA